MRLPAVPSKYVVEHLNSTYFNQVWNSPTNTGRVNFRLKKSAERIQTGAVPVNLSVVGLPTTGKAYSVYETGYRGFENILSRNDGEWIGDQTILDTLGFTMRSYTVEGRHIPLGCVYFRFLPVANRVLIAIESKYVKKCTGSSYPDLFLTAVRDTSRNSPVSFKTRFVSTLVNSTTTPASVSLEILQARTTYPQGTMVFVNGWFYDPNHVPTLANDDIVCITTDPDIVGFVDFIIDDNSNGYYSEEYGEYREFIHIPKSINPNNVILTTDNLTYCVINRQTHKGVYGHRVNPHAIESVTHNDFSIPHNAVQSFGDALGALGVSVRVYVRFSANPNYLHDDVNRMIDLYALSDTNIITQLSGTGSPQITEWRASELEQSEFLTLMYAYKGFNESEVLEKFEESVGYYDVASVIGQQMRRYTYRNSVAYIKKPVRLFGYECSVIVYVNGLKVPETNILLSNISDRVFSLSFTSDTTIVTDDTVQVYILEGGGRGPIEYNPTSVEPSKIVDSEDYELYEITTLGSPTEVWDGSVSKGYKKVPLAPAEYLVTQNSNGSFKYEVRSKNFDNNYYLMPKFGMINAVYDITQDVMDGKPIILDLTTTDADENIIPVFEYETMEVYLNGRRLISSLDYECKFTLDASGNILQNLLTISNAIYLDLEGGSNLVEVIVHGDKVLSYDVGYAVDNKLILENTPSIWSQSSGRAFVRGVLQKSVSELGNVMTPSEGAENGDPFTVEWNLAFGAEKLLKNTTVNDNRNLRSRIDHLLGIVPPDQSELIVVDTLHSLFSPFLAQIVTDVGNEEFFIIDEPSDERFIKQFSHYKPLLDRDPTIGANGILDRRFVTLAAHYVNYGVNDPEQMIRTQRLVSLVLTPSELSIKEVLI